MTDDTKAVAETYGHGGSVTQRNIHWRLSLGPMPVASVAIEAVLREKFLAKHVEVMEAAGISSPGATPTNWEKSAFQLFGHLAKAGEVERALDVARCCLTNGAESSRALLLAQAFAEKAGYHRLADQIATLTRPKPGASSRAADDDTVSVGATKEPLFKETVKSAATVPAAMRRELPQALKPKELPPQVEPAAMPPQPVKPKEQPPQVEPAAELRVLAPEGVQSMSGPRVEQAKPSQPVPSPSRAPSEGATITQVKNPFARKRPLCQPTGAGAPHMLRDAIGGNTGAPLKKAAKIN